MWDEKRWTRKYFWFVGRDKEKKGCSCSEKKREFFSDIGVDFPPHFRGMIFLSFGSLLIAVLERISSYFEFPFVFWSFIEEGVYCSFLSQLFESFVFNSVLVFLRVFCGRWSLVPNSQKSRPPPSSPSPSFWCLGFFIGISWQVRNSPQECACASH